jgi:hypothetical protein
VNLTDAFFKQIALSIRKTLLRKGYATTASSECSEPRTVAVVLSGRGLRLSSTVLKTQRFAEISPSWISIAQDMLHLGHHFDGRQRYVEDLFFGK